MKEWYASQEIADKTGITKRSINRRASLEGWEFKEQRAKGGCLRLFNINTLPVDIKNKMALSQIASGELKPAAAEFSYDAESLWAYYDSKTNKQKDKAKLKLRALQAAHEFMHSHKMGATDAFKAASKLEGAPSWATLRDLYHGRKNRAGIKLYHYKDWLPALVNNNNGNHLTAEFDRAAWEFIKADYLRLEQPAFNVCYERLQDAAGERGWQIPSCETIRRKIDELPIAQRVFLREGEHALMRLYPPMERTVKDLHAMKWLNGDGYQHNVFVRFPNGEIARPKTWFWQDIYSRRIISWRTDISENTDTIRLSFGDAVERFGIPDDITIDNTRAAANKWMTGGIANRYRFKVKEDDPLGIWPDMGINVHWSSVINGKGHGQAKPVERSFGIGGLEEYIDKHPSCAGAYTGANPNAKPENYGSTAIEFADFINIITHGVAQFNAKKKRKTETAQGIYSFDEVFEKSYANALVRKATSAQRRLWLLAAESVRIDSSGCVKLEAGKIRGENHKLFNRYGGDSHLMDRAGEKVVVRFDPQSLHSGVHLYTLSGQYISQAKCIEAHGFGDTTAGREHARNRTRWVKAEKAMAKAQQAMKILEVAAAMGQAPEPELPPQKVVQAVFGKTQGNAALKQDELEDFENGIEAADDLILQLHAAQKSE